MKFCYNIGETKDKSKKLCKYHENIFEKMRVARKQLHAFSSCVWRALFSVNLEKYLILWYNFSNITLSEKLR